MFIVYLVARSNHFPIFILFRICVALYNTRIYGKGTYGPSIKNKYTVQNIMHVVSHQADRGLSITNHVYGYVNINFGVITNPVHNCDHVYT